MTITKVTHQELELESRASALELEELATNRNQKLPEIIFGLGSDESAFIRWAAKEKYDTACHPMFFIMLNERTYAARMGWNAAKAHYAAAGCKGETDEY